MLLEHIRDIIFSNVHACVSMSVFAHDLNGFKLEIVFSVCASGKDMLLLSALLMAICYLVSK